MSSATSPSGAGRLSTLIPSGHGSPAMSENTPPHSARPTRASTGRGSTSPPPSDRTPGEIRARSSVTAADAAQLKVQITECLASFDAMHLLALIADISSTVTPSDSSLPIIPQAVVEYFATILLERQDPTGTADPANTPALRAAAQRAIGEIERLMSITLLAHMIDSGYAEDPLSQVNADLAFRDTVFRWPSYPDQERRALTELFAPREVREALVGQLSFGSEDALRLHDAMDRVLAAQRLAHARAHEKLIAERLPLDPQLAALGEPERRMLAIAMQLGPDLVDAWTVNETHLAVASGTRWQTCHAYLTLLASHFGDVKGTTLAHGRSRVRGRPLVTDDNDRYLPTSVDNALRALRPALEAALPSRYSTAYIRRTAPAGLRSARLPPCAGRCPRPRSGRTCDLTCRVGAITRPMCSRVSIGCASSSRLRPAGYRSARAGGISGMPSRACSARPQSRPGGWPTPSSGATRRLFATQRPGSPSRWTSPA